MSLSIGLFLTQSFMDSKSCNVSHMDYFFWRDVALSKKPLVVFWLVFFVEQRAVWFLKIYTY